jgi:hypothetical protein
LRGSQPCPDLHNYRKQHTVGLSAVDNR